MNREKVTEDTFTPPADRLIDISELEQMAVVNEDDRDDAKQDWLENCPDEDYKEILDAKVVEE